MVESWSRGGRTIVRTLKQSVAGLGASLSDGDGASAIIEGEIPQNNHEKGGRALNLELRITADTERMC